MAMQGRKTAYRNRVVAASQAPKSDRSDDSDERQHHQHDDHDADDIEDVAHCGALPCLLPADRGRIARTGRIRCKSNTARMAGFLGRPVPEWLLRERPVPDPVCPKASDRRSRARRKPPQRPS